MSLLGITLSPHAGKVMLYMVTQFSTIIYGPCILCLDAETCIAPARAHLAERRAIEVINATLLALATGLATMAWHGLNGSQDHTMPSIPERRPVAAEACHWLLATSVLVAMTAVVGLLSVRTSQVWFVRSFRLAIMSSLASYLIGVIIGGNIPELHDGPAHNRWFWVGCSTL
eukprot:SAG31_NODE_17089_length_684_cov_0.694017_1_plen_172_part_00